MFQYFLKRLVLACITLFFITFIVYGLVRAMPGSPVMLEEGFDPNRSMSEADRKEREKYFALDKPWYVGYFIWAGRLSPVALQVQEKAPFIRWPIIRFKSMDLGMSSREKTPVLNSIAQRLGPTLQLSIASLLITYMLSIPIGLYSSVHRGQKRERVLSLFLYGLYSFPSFVAALLLLLVFYQNMPWDWLKLEPGLHSANYESLSFFGKLGDNFKHMFLPTLCYSYGSLAYLSRFIKSNMEEVVRQDYIRTARAKGASEHVVIYKHALRNALMPVITLIGLNFGAMLGGTMIIESLFAMPGLGTNTITAIRMKDTPMVLASVLFTAFLAGVINLLVDIAYAYVDPRVKAQYLRR
jgi:peptide/nickel transport system permease protein